jgi:hypothetical protein
MLRSRSRRPFTIQQLICLRQELIPPVTPPRFAWLYRCYFGSGCDNHGMDDLELTLWLDALTKQ